MSKSILTRWAALGAAIALFAGCTSQTGQSDATSANVYLYQAPSSFNPLGPPQGAEQLTMSLVFDNLVTTGPDFEYIPRLAESWDISEDATEFTFNLRQGLTWSDGEPFDAEDVVFSLNTYANVDAASALRSRLSGVVGYADFEAGDSEGLAGVEAVDENTVTVTLAEPNAGFLSLIAYGSVFFILPEHVLGEVAPGELLDHEFFDRPDVGMGPYVMEAYNVDQDVVLSANDNYRDSVGIDTLYLKLVTSDVATAQIATGEIDLVQVSALDVESVEGVDGVTVSNAPSPGFFRLLPNFTKFSDERVRQAFLHAIDRQGIIDGILSGYAEPINSTIMTDWALTGDLDSYAYDPVRAETLLNEAGFDFSQEIKVSVIPGQRDRDQMVDVVVANLQDIGVNAVVEQINEASQLPMIEDATYDLMFSAGGVYTPDPASSSAIIACDQIYPAGGNTAHFCSEELDGLMADGAVSADPDDRSSIYQEAARLDNELVPQLWLNVPDTIWATSGRLEGFVPHGDFSNGFWNAAEWTISD